MTCFVVLNLELSGCQVTLLDGYGKCHLARLTSGFVAVAGSELHGPRAAIGLHFLVEAASGRRVSVEFLMLAVTRPEVQTPPPTATVPRRRSALAGSLRHPERTARHRHHTPSDPAGSDTVRLAALPGARPIVHEPYLPPSGKLAADGAGNSPDVPG